MIRVHGANRLLLSAAAILATLSVVHILFDPDPPPPTTGAITTSVPGWSPWTKRTRAIHSGPHALVGDPSVIRDGARLRMAYTCYDTARKGLLNRRDGHMVRKHCGSGPQPCCSETGWSSFAYWPLTLPARIYSDVRATQIALLPYRLATNRAVPPM